MSTRIDYIPHVAEGMISTAICRLLPKRDLRVGHLKHRVIGDERITLNSKEFDRLISLLRKISQRYPTSLQLDESIAYSTPDENIVGWIDFMSQEHYDFQSPPLSLEEVIWNLYQEVV